MHFEDLRSYRKKRRFDRTPEPAGDDDAPASGGRYLVQKHAARQLHYDLRLELGGALKSWAIPKGPSLDPSVKSLAVHVEDHPIEYASFEGVIPAGEYGGGTVMLWDRGTWEPEGDPERAYRNGSLKFCLNGEKLKGRWTLVQMRSDESDGNKNWLLIKKDDDQSRTSGQLDVLQEMPRSVATGRTMDEIAAVADRVWSSDGGEHDTVQPAYTSGGKVDPSSLPGARSGTAPRSFEPQLATTASQAPKGNEWLHELKFDGYRLVGRIEYGQPRLLTRGGNDWTGRFPTVAEAIGQLGWKNTVVDGEVVVMAKDGTTDFQALQNLLKHGRDADVVYYVFDLPFFDGYNLTSVPLLDRKRLLQELLGSQPHDGVVRYSGHIRGEGASVYQHACRHALEGLISKRADSRYEQRRSPTWVKSKCLKRQEFVIGGWTDPSGSREAFGSLLLGYYRDGRLVHCGRVGTGFTNQSLTDIKQELDRLAAAETPFDNPPQGRDADGVNWVKPRLVAEVEFTGWTDTGSLRHPSFQGLREDKPAEEVIREVPVASPQETARMKAPKTASARRAGSASVEIAGVRLSNPDRVMYPGQGVSKRELAEFFEAIADWILPHVVARPLTMVRCPKGRDGECFYQKNLTESMPDQLKGIQVQEKDEEATYVVIEDLAGLIALVQMSVLELHPWPARGDRLDRPDRLVFDLDPGEGVPWKAVIQAARDVRQRLEGYGLQCFVRTSGGKGLHVVAPIARRSDWDSLKQFAKAIADELTADMPDRYLATASKARRQGKVFIDYLRNQRGATAVASYSTRARAGAPVATPIRWDELGARMSPDKYHVRNLRNRLTSLGSDPWDGFFEIKQTLPKPAVVRR